MKDYQASLEKLRRDAAEAALIRDLATDVTKRVMFDRLHEQLNRLAEEVEAAMKQSKSVVLRSRFTFEHYFGTTHPNVSYPMAAGESESDDVVKVLVVEDDQLARLWSRGPFRRRFWVSHHNIRRRGHFATQEHTSQYRAVVTDINLVGQLDGWEVARAAREND